MRPIAFGQKPNFNVVQLFSKANPAEPTRTDASRFSFSKNDEAFLRIPVSYLLKLALAEAVGDPATATMVQSTGERLMDHFLSDNTSPEVFSFFPTPSDTSDRIEAGTELDCGSSASLYSAQSLLRNFLVEGNHRGIKTGS